MPGRPSTFVHDRTRRRSVATSRAGRDHGRIALGRPRIAPTAPKEIDPMLDALTIASVFAGFLLIIVVGHKLGAGEPDALAGLFMFQEDPLPRGVQESDLPPFVFRDGSTFGASAA
jgi:hypothetical protein